ncbi:conserved hypothetical protein [Candidatus Sulfopaludibacter sp. SbA4]|nr:conserved hypothetical protein [Candidatus Sulfopaludibacter sp. SbA4]
MSELTQKLKRLSAMRPRELAHRVREKVYSELDRVGAEASRAGGPRGYPACEPDFGTYLAGAPTDRFYCSQRENLRPFVRENFPQWIDRAVEEAERLCRHEVTLLGYGPADLGCQIDWHRDPVTGQTWERRYWADYRPVQDAEGRDPKIIHELNRHQHLPRLAKAYLLSGDERYAEEAVAQLNSWIDQNPPERGINWQSSLEIGIRAISWLWTIFPILPSRSFDDASAQHIGESLFAQLEHVHRYTSVFSSPNTHLIGEAAALFIAGLVFRDRMRPAVWLERGAALLTEAAEKQVLDDGVYGELSSCYHCYALDFYLQALVLAERNSFQFPEPVPHKVRGMLHFLMHLTRPDGTLPSLGDDDGGRALALDKRDYRSFQDGLCLGAILYRRGDFKYQAGAFSEEALWMLGQDAWEVYRQLESREPAEMQTYYPSAGYLVQRSGWGPLASHLVFDSGGLGMLTGAHAHADALSVTLFSQGRELLVDPGTFVYNCAPEWRSYFRSTSAHNTVTIDGRDQAEQGGTFHWKTKISCRVAREFTSSGIEYVEAEHDGYRRMPHGVIHRRRLLYIPPEQWIIVDDFRGSGEHTFDFHYHVPEDFEVSLFGSQPLTKARIAGWMSRGYGEKKPCSTLNATFTGPVPAAAMTFLTGESCILTVRQLTLQSGSGIACSYEHHGFEDIAVLSTGDSEIVVKDFRLRGEFFWLRLEEGELKQVLAVRASGLDHGGRSIFRRSEPGPYFGVINAGSEEESLCAEFAGS